MPKIGPYAIKSDRDNYIWIRFVVAESANILGYEVADDFKNNQWSELQPIEQLPPKLSVIELSLDASPLKFCVLLKHDKDKGRQLVRYRFRKNNQDNTFIPMQNGEVYKAYLNNDGVSEYGYALDFHEKAKGSISSEDYWQPEEAVLETLKSEFHTWYKSVHQKWHQGESCHELNFDKTDHNLDKSKITTILTAFQCAQIKAMLSYDWDTLKIESETSDEYCQALALIMTGSLNDQIMEESRFSPATKANAPNVRYYLIPSTIDKMGSRFYEDDQGKRSTIADVHQYIIDLMQQEINQYNPNVQVQITRKIPRAKIGKLSEYVELTPVQEMASRLFESLQHPETVILSWEQVLGLFLPFLQEHLEEEHQEAFNILINKYERHHSPINATQLREKLNKSLLHVLLEQRPQEQHIKVILEELSRHKNISIIIDSLPETLRLNLIKHAHPNGLADLLPFEKRLNYCIQYIDSVNNRSEYIASHAHYFERQHKPGWSIIETKVWLYSSYKQYSSLLEQYKSSAEGIVALDEFIDFAANKNDEYHQKLWEIFAGLKKNWQRCIQISTIDSNFMAFPYLMGCDLTISLIEQADIQKLQTFLDNEHITEEQLKSINNIISTYRNNILYVFHTAKEMFTSELSYYPILLSRIHELAIKINELHRIVQSSKYAADLTAEIIDMGPIDAALGTTSNTNIDIQKERLLDFIGLVEHQDEQMPQHQASLSVFQFDKLYDSSTIELAQELFEKLLPHSNQTEAAIESLKTAEIHNLPSLQNYLGTLYFTGAGGFEKNWQKAFQLFEAAAKDAYPAYPNAQYNLGVMYLNGYGIEEDQLEGFRWITRAAESGLAIAENYRDFLRKYNDDTHTLLHAIQDLDLIHRVDNLNEILKHFSPSQVKVFYRTPSVIKKLFSILKNHEDLFSIFLKADDETVVHLFDKLPNEELNRIKNNGDILPAYNMNRYRNRAEYNYIPIRANLMFFHETNYNDIAQNYADKVPDIITLKKQLLVKHAELGSTAKASDFMAMFYEFQFTIAKLLLIPCKSILIEEIDCLKKITMDSQNPYITSAARTAAQTKLDKLVDIIFNLSLDFSNIEERLNLALSDKNSELNRVLNIPLPKNPYLRSEQEYISHLHSIGTANQSFSLDVLGSMVETLLNGQFFDDIDIDAGELNELTGFMISEYFELYKKCEMYNMLDSNSSKSEKLYDEINAKIHSIEQLLRAIREQLKLNKDYHIPVDRLLLCEEISTATQSWIDKIEEERRNSFGNNFRIF